MKPKLQIKGFILFVFFEIMLVFLYFYTKSIWYVWSAPVLIVLAISSSIQLFIQPGIQWEIKVNKKMNVNDHQLVQLELKKHSFGWISGRILFRKKYRTLNQEHLEIFPFSFLKRKNLSFDFVAERVGSYELLIQKIEMMDLFHLFIKEQIFEDRQLIKVYAPYIPLRIQYDHAITYEDEQSQQMIEQKYRNSTDFSGVREYEKGDSLKSIHWKITGKLDRLMVRNPLIPERDKLRIAINTSLEKMDVLAATSILKFVISLCNRLHEEAVVFETLWIENGELVTIEVYDDNQLQALIDQILEIQFQNLRENEQSILIQQKTDILVGDHMLDFSGVQWVYDEQVKSENSFSSKMIEEGKPLIWIVT